jgi:glycosyltransferase involved in cell wall biosynthesis
MPTRDRRAFVPLAVDCFLAQDYPERELVVLDDGREPIRDLLPDDPRIRYERLGRQLVIGAKRNRACGLARGELIAHWDDDDWSAPGRLSAQVAALERAGAAVTGLRSLHFLDPVARRAWLYTYPPRSSRPWVAGGSLCYRRKFWKAHPFQEVAVGEDTRFVWARGTRVLALERRDLYVAMMHSGNTSPKRPRAPRWTAARAGDVEKLLGGHAAAYGRAASGDAPAARDLQAAPDHVTVTIPYYRCREHIRQCVESVLTQTHTELTAVVVNDGDPEPPWSTLTDIDDKRLVRFDLTRNRGRYFADQVVLAATTSRYLLIHDADDWSEPRRLEVLLARLRAEDAVGAVSAARRSADRHGPARVITMDGVSRPLSPRFAHIANLHGLFRTDALRALGGFYAGFVVGYDSFLINALAMTGHVARVEEPLYHWRARANSLTNAAATGMGSELRRTTARELQVMYRAAYRSYAQHHAGRLEADALATSIRELVVRRVGSRVQRELASESRRLEAKLRPGLFAPAPVAEPAVRKRGRAKAPRRVPARVGAGRGAAAPPMPAPTRRRRVQRHRRASTPPKLLDVHGVIARAEPSWGAWAISRPFAVELAERLERREPKRILELGSGVSTAVLAQYAARHSAQVVSLEHEALYATRTSRLLLGLGLAAAVDLRRAPLRDLDCPDGRKRPSYSASLHGEFDFVLADGPPGARGRGGTLFAVEPLLAGDWELWLDDAHRAHERECLELWREHLSLDVTLHDLDGKGLAVLGPPGRTRDPAERAPRGLGIGVLTGGRPDLLRRTLDSLAATAPRVLRDAYVRVHVNGHDPDSEAYVRGLDFVDHVTVSRRRLPVGPATSKLMSETAAAPGVRFVLHLEDDWSVCTLASGWLRGGLDVLRSEPDIGQVRLRHRSDRVLGRHMITQKPIAWKPDGAVLRSPSAHFTFNPSLIRAEDVARLFPCDSERAAQEAFVRAGLGSAQLSPGVFRHIGGGASLRAPSTPR